MSSLEVFKILLQYMSEGKSQQKLIGTINAEIARLESPDAFEDPGPTEIPEEVHVPGEESAIEEGEKRGRGRPKGSRNVGQSDSDRSDV